MLKHLGFCAVAGALMVGGCARDTASSSSQNAARARAQGEPDRVAKIPSVENAAAKKRNQAVVALSKTNSALETAMAKGRATLPQFVTALKNPQPGQSEFAVYARFRGGDGHSEYLWLSPVKLSGNGFRGTINNRPRLQKLKLGQTVTVPAADAMDWMYLDHKKLVGAQTSRVMRDQMTTRQRAAFDQSLPYRFD